MAFDGTLIKIGNTNLPLSYVQAKSYKITPAQRLDLDSYRNANGELMRNVLEHTASKIEIATKQMNNADMANLMGLIRGNFLNEQERKVSLTYYCPDTDSYATGTFYIPDPQYPIDRVDPVKKEIWYNSITLKFIEY